MDKLVVVIVTGGRKYGDLHCPSWLTSDEIAKRRREYHKIQSTLSMLAFLHSTHKVNDDNWLPWDFEIVEGDAYGADRGAADWATVNYTKHKPFPPDLDKHGSPAAFFIRNQEMAYYGRQMQDKGHKVIVVAFPGGNGTADMVKRARANGLEVMEIDYDCTVNKMG